MSLLPHQKDKSEISQCPYLLHSRTPIQPTQITEFADYWEGKNSLLRVIFYEIFIVRCFYEQLF